MSSESDYASMPCQVQMTACNMLSSATQKPLLNLGVSESKMAHLSLGLALQHCGLSGGLPGLMSCLPRCAELSVGRIPHLMQRLITLALHGLRFALPATHLTSERLDG